MPFDVLFRALLFAGLFLFSNGRTENREYEAEIISVLPYRTVNLDLSYASEVESCQNRSIHSLFDGHGYYFSWYDPGFSILELNWTAAKEYCQRNCMNLVSIETKEENDFIKEKILKGNQSEIWTSGRRCNLSGCERPNLVPPELYEWFWGGSLERLPPITNRFDNDWSDSGGLGLPQPDNAEYVQGGQKEDCLAILNNKYDDDVKWHDMACYHNHPFICEDYDKPIKELIDSSVGISQQKKGGLP